MELTNINFLNGLIAFLGMVLFFLIRYQKRKKKTIPFSGAYWLNDNLLELIISLITSGACFLMLDDIIYYVSQFSPQGLPLVKITAFICGYGNQWVLKLITKPFKGK